MTDGQSFYLVLTIFYLMECIKFAPQGSEALVSITGKFGKYSLRHPFTEAWGLKKSIFFAPILPWPASMYFLSGYKKEQRNIKPITRVSSIGHHHRFLQQSIRYLNTFAIVNLLNFFAVLPLLYVRTYDERTILYGIAYSYATLFATALYYHRLHKRILPSYKADRLKTTIYTALLPWHAPRCADEILLKSSLRWSPIAALAANAKNEGVRSLLKYHWRAAHYLAKPRFEKDAVREALSQTKLDFSDWLEAPQNLDSPQYCPCCHNGYEKQASHCSDCKGVALNTFRKEADSQR